MNKYETIFIINSNLEESAIKGVIEKFSNLINTNGKVESVDEWGKKNYGDAPGIITTRDATRIKRYKDNNSFDMSRIVIMF